MRKTDTAKKAARSLIAVFVLTVCLVMTSAALIYSTVAVRDNFFLTGFVKIDLNGGKSIIKENEFLFEPGGTYQKQFYLKNESSCEVYWRIYFDEIKGDLADILLITVSDENEVLFSGKVSDFKRESVETASAPLRLHEKKELEITFYFPEKEENHAQAKTLAFKMCADAVQVKNNPNRVFAE